MLSYINKIVLVVCACLVANLAQAYAVGMGDPLRPPEYGLDQSAGNTNTSSEPQWHVNEILFSGGRRVAIVNDVTVGVGDRIGGARVVDIKPEHIVLEYKNSLINAMLHPVSVKKPSLIKIN